MEEIPETIGKYKINRLLGEGAMGLVYEGMDTAIDRRVAIKTLHPHLLNNRDKEEFLQRFQREAKSAARCTHPNIVMVLEYGEDNDLPFIAMEFVDGMSLQELIQSGKKISLNNSLMIISQLLKAIHAAHQLGVIHRDIKTANVMVCNNNSSIKLADFGIARFTDTASMTLTGAVVGTPRYMAPEQMFGLKVDHRADLFSITMVFVELLSMLPDQLSVSTSRLPVQEGLPQNNKINYSCPYPEPLIPILKKGLASKPAERFQSAKEYASALQQVLPALKQIKTSRQSAAQASPDFHENDQILAQDLDSLTTMLAEYIGPVARNVLKEQSTHHASLGTLVNAVAEEIPQSDLRKKFIDSWAQQSGTRIEQKLHSQTSNSLGSQNSHNSISLRGSSIRLDENTIQKISKDFISYIGPLASRLVDYYCEKSADKSEFIHNLADEIPDQRSRDEFIKKWSMV